MRQPAAAMKNISKRMEDITSLAAIRAYFEFYRDLYGKEDLDREKILLAFENEMLPFASVAEKVRVIESCTTPVYIPIDQGEASSSDCTMASVAAPCSESSGSTA